LAEFHDLTLKQYAEAIIQGLPLIVVDNTNIRVFEIAPYYRLAEAFGYDVEIFHVVADVGKCKKNNVHGVPSATIDMMANSLEAIPAWWKQRLVLNN
jgi:peroxiredoxin family protein